MTSTDDYSRGYDVGYRNGASDARLDSSGREEQGLDEQRRVWAFEQASIVLAHLGSADVALIIASAKLIEAYVSGVIITDTPEPRVWAPEHTMLNPETSEPR